ncbi:hypothetical protein BDV29DRAFT_185507 [Aspergillus leporis]|uniref:Uncharacterized protein n=1 Tax=Aspergillus leporis TaxID=41062 RepID=A0A5N5WHD0_9EURO|nr:hypothetical protein BDV29DRAFT_185507 [Aspergillus leporis]
MWSNRVRLPSMSFPNALLASSPGILVAMKVGFFGSFGPATSSSSSSVEGRLFNGLRVPVCELFGFDLWPFPSFFRSFSLGFLLKHSEST